MNERGEGSLGGEGTGAEKEGRQTGRQTRKEESGKEAKIICSLTTGWQWIMFK